MINRNDVGKFNESMDQLNVNSPVDEWHSRILQCSNGNDFIFFSKDISHTIWFATNYLQFLSRNGNCEVVSLFGKLISNLETFVYQVNYSLPVGYRLRTDYHALYDLLLNFETEPLRRAIFWNDANFLFKENRSDFEMIFEAMITSAYCNRNALSTVKEDGSRYIVDQRNLFFFNEMDPQYLVDLLNREYYIPSIDADPKGSYSKIEFNLVELTG